MKKYNYLEAVTNDVMTYINENYNEEFLKVTLKYEDERESFEEDLNNILWTEDSVTGNASSSYTFNAYTAEEYICHNIGLAMEAFAEFNYTANNIKKHYETFGIEGFDVTIRCYLLSQAISQALDSIKERFESEVK